MKLRRLAAVFSVILATSAAVSGGNTCVHPLLPSFADDHTTQAEPTLAVFGGTVVVAFVSTQHDGILRSDRSVRVAYARSEDGGINFEEVSVLPAAHGVSAHSNPTLVVSRGGTLFLAVLQQGVLGPQVAVARSVDGGRAFELPIQVPNPRGSTLADIPHLALAPDGEEIVYVAWTDLLLRQVFFSRSLDGGRSFELPVALTEGNAPKLFARLAAGKNGLLYCLWIEAKGSPSVPVFVRRSLDYGRSWGQKKLVAFVRFPWDRSTPEAAHLGVGFIRGGIRALGVPSVAVNSATGHLYMALQSASPDLTDTDVFFLAVDADIEVVVPLTRVNDDATSNDQFMPALAVSPRGEVGILFYDRRLDQDNSDCDVFFARSMDGGMMFTNERITSVSFPVPPLVGQPSQTGHFDGLRRAGYFGGYISIVADSGFFYLAWTDARNIVRTPNYPQGRADLDVYFTRIPMLRRD